MSWGLRIEAAPELEREDLLLVRWWEVVLLVLGVLVCLVGVEVDEGDFLGGIADSWFVDGPMEAKAKSES